MALEAGEYNIKFYNRKGSLLRDHTRTGKCLTQSRESALNFIDLDDNIAVSFTIDRRVFNSLDNLGRW